ncbi:threonine-phosphate decarboxylase CobD [Methylocapsa polymorpha]|uniref:threonine-phosphate decarboxylase n=1 Tax=Methylocapsa polymorpha TaxID=3080828 RepID=A0ABZ0HYP7_9HYPH|nr:threonine-phosphate decarboxylase CobD [Methylocapsa sp. RX1]
MRQIPAIETQELAGAGHGGNLSAARRAFPLAPEPWLDLSTGVSPYAYPLADLSAEAWTRLPDPSALCALESAAALAYRAPEGAAIVAAPGTQSIIGWLPHLVPARRVGILGFTYSEHSRVWRASGAEVAIVEDLAELADKDVAIVVNPNNPDGRLVAAQDLRALAADLGKHGGLLIVDEAFMDFLSPGASIVPDMPPAGVVALRSFGKAYGLPGLRLGFAIAPDPLAAKLRAALGCWPVSGAAIAIGSTALSDLTWLAATGKQLAIDVGALDETLVAAGFNVLGGGPLFRLTGHVDVSGWFETLAKAGILVRRFDARPSWLRFGIPGREADLSRLRGVFGLD